MSEYIRTDFSALHVAMIGRVGCGVVDHARARDGGVSGERRVSLRGKEDASVMAAAFASRRKDIEKYRRSQVQRKSSNQVAIALRREVGGGKNRRDIIGRNPFPLQTPTSITLKP